MRFTLTLSNFFPFVKKKAGHTHSLKRFHSPVGGSQSDKSCRKHPLCCLGQLRLHHSLPSLLTQISPSPRPLLKVFPTLPSNHPIYQGCKMTYNTCHLYTFVHSPIQVFSPSLPCFSILCINVYMFVQRRTHLGRIPVFFLQSYLSRDKFYEL